MQQAKAGWKPFTCQAGEVAADGNTSKPCTLTNLWPHTTQCQLWFVVSTTRSQRCGRNRWSRSINPDDENFVDCLPIVADAEAGFAVYGHVLELMKT